MRTPRSLFSLTPHQLLIRTRELLAARAENTAELLEHLAEIDTRRLYVEAAYASMQAFCVGELGMSEDSADKKMQAARAMRRFPELIAAIAAGRLHLSAVNLLASRLTPENLAELIALASRRSCAQIRVLLAERDGQPARRDLLAQTVVNPQAQPDSNQVMSSAGHPGLDPETVSVASGPPAPKLCVLPFTVPVELAEAYREALTLAPYEVARDPARAFALMLAAWREKLEKRRIGSASQPSQRRGTSAGRHVPAEVRRTVWQRDGGQCTFTSEAGKRCKGRSQLELDHVTPVALGGRSNAENLRLRCRAHNQLEAERAFGTGFMQAKREAARAAHEAARVEREQVRAERERARSAELARRTAADEVVPYLRRLGLRAGEASQVALRAAATPGIALEQRVLAALRMLAPRVPQARAADPVRGS